MIADDPLVQLIQLSEQNGTDRELSLDEAFDFYAREQAIANVRLSNLPITDELLNVYERHMRGEITIEEAFKELGIYREGN